MHQQEKIKQNEYKAVWSCVAIIGGINLQFTTNFIR